MIKGLFKGLGYLLYFTFPILLCVVAFFGGGAAGDAAFGGRYEKWEQEQISGFTHTVTIYWDESNVPSILEVREDINWNINGCNEVQKLYGSLEQNETVTELPERSYRQNMIFVGLFTTPDGGTQYVNTAGYSLRSVTSDLTLYAVWRVME